MLQPLNVVLLVNKFKILLSIILVIGVINIWFLDDLKILLISYAYLNPKLASMYALLDGVQFVHEKRKFEPPKYGISQTNCLVITNIVFPVANVIAIFSVYDNSTASRGVEVAIISNVAFQYTRC